MTGTFKKILTVILAIVMVAALLLGCVACSNPTADDDDKKGNGGTNNNETNKGENNNNEEDNSSKYEGLSDVEYAQALALDGTAAMVDALVAGVDAYANALGTTTTTASGNVELSLNLGDMLIDMVEQAIFGTTESGMDMSFLSNIGLDMELDSTGEMMQLKVALELASKEIVDLVMLTDMNTMWFGIPELADGFLEIGLEDVVAVEAAMPAYAEMLTAAISENDLADILNRYLSIIVKELDNVERTTETLTLDGLSQNATKLTFKVYEQDALDAARAVLTAAKDDKDLKKLVEDFGEFYNEMMAASYADLADYGYVWEDVDAYTLFSEAVDSALAELPAEAETEESFSVILYVDDNHNVIGCALDASVLFEDVQANESRAVTAATISFYTVTDGDNFASIFEIPVANVAVTGKGTKNNGATTGTYTIVSQGVTFGTIELKNFAADTDALSGTVILKPSADLMDSLFGGAIPYLGVEDVALELTLDITNDKVDMEAKLIGDDAMIVGIAIKAATKTPGNIKAPNNAVDVTDYEAFMNWVAGIDFGEIVDNLEDAGVPDSLLTALESLVPAM